MSLYQLQKFLYDINRDPGVQGIYRADLEGLLDRYELTSEERSAQIGRASCRERV